MPTYLCKLSQAVTQIAFVEVVADTEDEAYEEAQRTGREGAGLDWRNDQSDPMTVGVDSVVLVEVDKEDT